MKTIQVRLSDEEEAILEERVRVTGLSVSQLVRDFLFPGKDGKSPPVFIRDEREIAVLVALREEVATLAKRSAESDAVLEKGLKTLSDLIPLLTVSERANPSVESEKSLALVQETKRAIQGFSQQLQGFSSEKVLARMVAVLTEVIERGLQKSLTPLHEGVERATREIEGYRKNLWLLSWDWRLMMAPALAVLLTAIVGGSLVRMAVTGLLNEERYYGAWARKVEAKIRAYPPKEQAEIYRRIGGRP